jgi:4-hydroxy-tetrahydrodipicolinate synthase
MEKNNFQSIPANARALTGVIPAIITPFRRDGNRLNHSINYDMFGTLLDRFIQSGIRGVVIAGCTGSGNILTEQEHVDLVKYAQENFGKKIRIISGDGKDFTLEALHLKKRIEQETGVHYHLSKSPGYLKPSDSGLLEHYTHLANNIEGGIILYSVPSRSSGRGLLPKIVEKLSHHPRIIGIKDASGNLERVKKTIIKGQSSTFSVLSGNDGESLEVLAMGGRGLISTAANIFPLEMKEMIEEIGKEYEIKTDYSEKSRLLKKMLNPFFESLFPKSKKKNPSSNPSTTHYALNKIGYDVGIPRSPLGEISPEESRRISESILSFKNFLNKNVLT